MKRLAPFQISLLFLAIFSTPPAQAADTTAPVITSWKLINETADAITGDALFTVEFSVFDDSQVVLPALTLQSKASSQYSDLFFPNIVSKVGGLNTYTVTGKIAIGKAAGEWSWVIPHLRDDLGNYAPGYLPGGNWPTSVWVLDQDFTEAKRAEQLAAAQALAAEKLRLEQELTAARKSAEDFAKTAPVKVTIKKKITCYKGNLKKVVYGLKPSCPKGYKTAQAF
jgi:hypothetical protein